MLSFMFRSKIVARFNYAKVILRLKLLLSFTSVCFQITSLLTESKGKEVFDNI